MKRFLLENHAIRALIGVTVLVSVSHLISLYANDLILEGIDLSSDMRRDPNLPAIRVYFLDFFAMAVLTIMLGSAGIIYNVSVIAKSHIFGDGRGHLIYWFSGLGLILVQLGISLWPVTNRTSIFSYFGSPPFPIGDPNLHANPYATYLNIPLDTGGEATFLIAPFTLMMILWITSIFVIMSAVVTTVLALLSCNPRVWCRWRKDVDITDENALRYIPLLRSRMIRVLTLCVAFFTILIYAFHLGMIVILPAFEDGSDGARIVVQLSTRIPIFQTAFYLFPVFVAYLFSVGRLIQFQEKWLGHDKRKITMERLEEQQELINKYGLNVVTHKSMSFLALYFVPAMFGVLLNLLTGATS